MSIFEEVEALCKGAKAAARETAACTTRQKNQILLDIATALPLAETDILRANALDLENAEKNGLSKPMLDRLLLTHERLLGIANALRELVSLEDPIGKGEEWVRPSGITIHHIRAPLGVCGIIYEARPNVTVDAAAMCLKTGNAVVLRGGKEAIHSNTALVSVMQSVLKAHGLSPAAISLIRDTSRESSTALMQMRGLVDVLIPRGSRNLIRAVTENANLPVIETGAGNCHLYVDADADLEMAIRVAINAKCSRPSVCNAIEALLVHRAVAEQFLPRFYSAATKDYPLTLRGCARTCAILPEAEAATESDWETEYDDYILALKVVDSLDEAIAHISRYSTGHSEAIITGSIISAKRFQSEIDAACIYVNASTRFTDGGEFGFGAEIGISTQKLHARGPMGLAALTTDKYLINGDGSIR